MAYEALDTLQQTLDQILNHHDHLNITPPVRQDIFSIRDQVVFLQWHLKQFPDKERIREAAYTVQEIIEYLFSEENLPVGGVRFKEKMRKLAKKLEPTVADVLDYIKSEESVNGERPSPAVSSSSRPVSTSKDVVVGFNKHVKVIKHRRKEGSSSTSKDVVVGFHEDVLLIKDWLEKGSSDEYRLQVLPIVGTGGIGKTTLAKTVYSVKYIEIVFSFRAWITISQDYSVASIALNLLASMKEILAKSEADREIPMESLIRKRLCDSKYLIVIDDMCSKKAWDDVKTLFPDNNYGSRIIVTTRLQDVAAYVASSSFIHTMRLLDAQHSWNLLRRKVFGYANCPIELEDIGEKIAMNCGGLPLSIVVVAGLLSKFHTRDSWKQIAANGAQLETLISLSYTHLPDDSKACFLYMVGFPEDYEIRVSELINLWISEGFLKHSDESKGSEEEEAEDCLEDLAERSLVLVNSRKTDGKIKSCSLHDIVRDFCVRQAMKEKVILPVTDYLPTPILRSHFLPRLIKDHPRISATSYDLRLKDYTHSSHLCTIICIPKTGYRSKGSIEKFSSLKILHFLRGNNHWNWEPGQVFNLIHLTYLACNIPTSIVPPAISKLRNIQTLSIYSYDVRLPVEIWRLRRLIHLVAFSFQPLPQPDREALSLENLQTLSLAKDLVCSERMVEMIPNIKKLRLCYSEKKFDVGCQLNNLKHLWRLEKLKLKNLDFSYRLCRQFEMEVAFPLLLKKLTLSCWRLPWDSAGIIGSFPSLQVLKLRKVSFQNGYWETYKGQFGELRVLLIDDSNLCDWITESSHLPKLEHLMINYCPHLSEIPSSIGDIPTLEMIEVSVHLFSSAKSILRKRLQYGNSRFQVRVKQTPSEVVQIREAYDLVPKTRDIMSGPLVQGP